MSVKMTVDSVILEWYINRTSSVCRTCPSFRFTEMWVQCPLVLSVCVDESVEDVSVVATFALGRGAALLTGTTGSKSDVTECNPWVLTAGLHFFCVQYSFTFEVFKICFLCNFLPSEWRSMSLSNEISAAIFLAMHIFRQTLGMPKACSLLHSFKHMCRYTDKLSFAMSQGLLFFLPLY